MVSLTFHCRMDAVRLVEIPLPTYARQQERAQHSAGFGGDFGVRLPKARRVFPA